MSFLVCAFAPSQGQQKQITSTLSNVKVVATSLQWVDIVTLIRLFVGRVCLLDCNQAGVRAKGVSQR